MANRIVRLEHLKGEIEVERLATTVGVAIEIRGGLTVMIQLSLGDAREWGKALTEASGGEDW